MQYYISSPTRGMPVAPIPAAINSANGADAALPFCTSGMQAARLPPRRVSPRASLRSILVRNREAGAGLNHFASSSSNLVLLQNNGALKIADEHVGSPPQLKPPVYSSPDYECDLAAMVQDFMENGSHGYDFDKKGSGESIGTASTDLKPLEALQAVVLKSTEMERELMSAMAMIILSMSDQDLPCRSTFASRKCEGQCIRRLLVEQLHLMKYNAAVCKTKWASAGKVPGGEYELIDVIFDDGHGQHDRVIVDVDFRSQFEIARPTASYLAALRCLPVLFIGSSEKLSQILHILAGAAKSSLKQNAMPLPPWRTLAYMSSKWMSSCERLEVGTDRDSTTSTSEYRGDVRCTRRTEQCAQELQYLKVCMSSSMCVPQTIS